jgi:hypothetical protein
MAKGDKQKVEQSITRNERATQGAQDAMMNNLYGSNQQFQQNYNYGTGANLADYGNIMNNYQNFYNSIGAGGPGGGGGGGGIGGDVRSGYEGLAAGNKFGWDPMFRGAIGSAIGHYGNFADTGGFSEADKQNIRERSIAPTRAVYSRGQENLSRNRALQGFSPNYAAASTRMARDMGQAVADANIGANAEIARMVQQGKMFGASGLESAGLGGQGRSTDIDALNLQAQLAGLQGMQSVDASNRAFGAASSEADRAAQLAALSGMTGLYGATPGLSNMFGNQLLNSGNQLLAGQQLQQGAGLGFPGLQLGASQVPGNWQQAMGNIGSGLKIAGQVGAAIGTGGASLMMPGGGMYGPGSIGGLFGGNKPYIPPAGSGNIYGQYG